MTRSRLTVVLVALLVPLTLANEARNGGRLPPRETATQKLRHSIARNYQLLGVNRAVESLSKLEELQLDLRPEQYQGRRVMESSTEFGKLAYALPDGDRAELSLLVPKATASLVFISQVQQ